MDIMKYDFTFPSSFLFLGKTQSGKTTLMKRILFKYKKQFSRIYVYCPIFNNDYDFINKKFILRDIDKLELLIDAQYKLKEHNKNKPILIVLDDWIGSLDVKHNKVLSKLATTGRHCSMSTFYLCQFINEIPPVIRQNFNYLVILSISEDALINVSSYQDTYTKRDLYKFYQTIKETPYNGLLIDNNKPYIMENKKLQSVIHFY